MYWYYCLTLFVCIYVCIYNLPLYTIYSLILHVYFHMLSIFIYLIIPYLFKISKLYTHSCHNGFENEYIFRMHLHWAHGCSQLGPRNFKVNWD